MLATEDAAGVPGLDAPPHEGLIEEGPVVTDLEGRVLPEICGAAVASRSPSQKSSPCRPGPPRSAPTCGLSPSPAVGRRR